MPDDREKQLALRLGGALTRILFNALPKISEALTREQPSASVSITCAFTHRPKEGGYFCRITAKERIPLTPMEFKVGFSKGQLSLFEGEPKGE